MIIGNISNPAITYLPDSLLEILEEHAPSTEVLGRLPDGTTELGDSGRLRVLLSTVKTQPVEERRTEFHREYIDIQVLLEGTEWIGIGPTN